jgi:protein-S-isoprenylcysteine O-methyltransferase Ste14
MNMRDTGELPVRTRGLTAIAGALALIAVLLMVQIWLLSATLESFLRGNLRASLPAAIVSGVILLICVGLYLFVARVDAEVGS